jgi:hypothetical protein
MNGLNQDVAEIKENVLLARLPSDVFDRLLPYLEICPLPMLKVLYDFDDSVTHLYFPNRSSIISTLCRTDEHINVEVALCGNEGMAGFTSICGMANSPFQNLVQVPGTASRLPMGYATEEFRRGGVFQELVVGFMNSSLVQTSQTALCNRIHSDQERLARWVLLSDDRAQAGQLPLPRDLLAKMLGRNHSGVSVAAAVLERAGLIRYDGAELVIIDREKLESVVCSCYWVVRRQQSAAS